LYFLPFHVARAFVERQWEFRPVIFEYGEIHRAVGDDEILPFLDEDIGGEGGFGIVWTVKIHASAQKLVSSSLETVVIARKELRETDSGNERTILELLRHPNIVRVFGSYTHHGVHNLRFPYVSMNLEGLFQQMSIIDSHVVISGIYGLSDALSKIHDFSSVDDNIEIKSIGYHPDLRLANILVEDD
jgi:serine/threonine protein kinase